MDQPHKLFKALGKKCSLLWWTLGRALDVPIWLIGSYEIIVGARGDKP